MDEKGPVKRPGRGNLTFEDVAAAAEQMAAQGRQPVLRAVREALGRGSLSTIHKHLLTWQGRQSTSISPFSVTAADVETLSPIDFVRLINHLVRSEAARISQSAAISTTTRIDDADGGIDGLVELPESTEPTTFLPHRDIAWQAKSGRRLTRSAMLAELRTPRGETKTAIQQLIDRGGTYVLYAAADMTPLQKQAVHDAFAEGLGISKDLARVVVFGGDDIAAWASKDLWARTFLIRSAGRAQPTTLLTFDEWSRMFSNPYVWVHESEEAAKALRDAIETPGSIHVVDGVSGIGKTRFSLESLRATSDRLGVVYYDSRPTTDYTDILGALVNWRRLGVRGVVVIDDCTPELHQQAKAIVVGSNISVLAIMPQVALLSDWTVRELSSDSIRSVIAGVSGSGTTDFAYRASQYAQGWPKMALLVFEAIRRGNENAFTLNDEALTERLVTLSGHPDELRIVTAMSVFAQVGNRGSVREEWRGVCERLTPDISPERFFSVCRQFEKKRVIKQIGRYWRVEPAPLALRLLSHWLSESPEEDIEALFEDLSPALQSAVGVRLSEISSDTSINVAAQLLSMTGSYGSRDRILSRRGSDMVYRLAIVNPRAACGAICRVVLDPNLPIEDLREADGRQNLAFALESIAFHQSFFGDATLCLQRLAAAETETHGNNAAGTFSKFFRVRGSQTEATPEQRLKVLARAIDEYGLINPEIPGAALKALLSHEGGIVRLGPEFQGGRPRLSEWAPAIWKDVFDYWSAGVSELLRFASLSDAARRIARDTFADGITTLAMFRRWDDLERGLEVSEGGAWPKAIEHLTWVLSHALPKENEEDRRRAELILERLQPKDLNSLIELRLINPPHELVEVDGHYKNMADTNAENFAIDCLKNGSVPTVLRVITQKPTVQAFNFARAVGLHCENLRQAVDDALVIYASSKGGRSDFPLVGLFEAVAEREMALREDLLDRIAADALLAEALPALCTTPKAYDSDVDRLIQGYQSGRLELPRDFLFMGRRFADCELKGLRKLVAALLDRTFYNAAFELMTYGTADREGFDDLFARAILESDAVVKELPSPLDWTVLQKAHKIIRDGNVTFALAVANRLMDRSSLKQSYSLRERGTDLWPDILSTYANAVWPRIQERFSSLDERGQWQFLYGFNYHPEGEIGERLALEALPMNLLVAFAQAFPNVVPGFLARYGDVLTISAKVVPDAPDETVEVSDLLKVLLEHFGEQDDVLAGIGASFLSFLSVGNRAPYYERRTALVDAIPTFDNPKLEAWKRTLRAHLESEREHAADRDSEVTEGIF